MIKITKKTINRISQGDQCEFMNAIEFLIDTYDEDKFDAGYKSCLGDMSVRSYRLAEHIIKDTSDRKSNIETLSAIIEAYFNEAIKQE